MIEKVEAISASALFEEREQESASLATQSVRRDGTLSLRSAYAYSLAGTVLISIMGAVSGIVCARMLGTVGRGELALLILLPSLIIRLGNLNITQAIAYLASPARPQPGALGSTGVLVAVLLGVMESLLLLPFIHFVAPGLKNDQHGVAVLCLALVPATYSVYVLLGIDLAKQHFLRYSLYQALPSVLYVGFLIGSSLARRVSASSFAEALLCAWAVVVVIRLPEILQLFRGDHIRISTIRTLLAWGVKLSLPDLAGLILLRIDYPLLARWVSTADLGYYSVALAIATGQALTASPISQVCFQMTSSNSNSEDSLSSLVRQFRLFQLIFALIAGISILIAPALIRIAFGAQFVTAVDASRILIVTMSLWSCSQLLDNGMRGLGRQNLSTWSNVIALSVVIALANSAVHRFGISGMAMVICVGQLISIVAKVLMLHFSLGTPLRQFWVFDRHGIAEIAAVSFRQVGEMWSTLKYFGRRAVLPHL